MWPLLAGAGVGLLKNIVDTGKARDRQAGAAKQTEFSPWTHLGKGADIEQPNMISDALGGAIAGADLSHGLKASDLQEKMANAWLKRMDPSAFEEPAPAPIDPWSMAPINTPMLKKFPFNGVRS